MSTTPGKARASSARTKATATRTKTQATAAEKSTPKVNRAVATASRSPGTAAAKSTPVTAKTAATKKKLNSNVKSALRGMTFTLGQGEISTSSSDCLVLLCPAAVASVASALTQVDAASAGQLSQLIEREGFTAKPGQTLLLLGDYGLRATRILLLGIGDGSVSALRQSLNAVPSVLKPFPIRTLAISLVTSATLDSQTQARAIAECLSLIEHRADHLKSEPASVALQLQTVSLYGNAAEADAIRSGLATGRAIGQGMNLARFLGDLPGNLCTPSYLADQAKQLAASHKKLSVEVLEEKQMKTLGMGSLLSVAAGSDQPAKLIVLQYQGGSKKEAPIALVGKGITFDTGGISLKPGAGMDEMKYDMCGAASVLGTFKTLNELNLPINVVGVIAATENMPNGNATKPGDIVTSMAGLTIEILNTDAEGRLVLCDALTYCQTRFKPKAVVDIATLTGACVIALGAHASGLFSNDQSLSEALRSAGETSGDRAWPMPIWDEYQKQLDSNFADLANIGGREAGSVTAACFLSRFTKDVAWAHLDVAGTAWKSGAAKGATGRPVGLLVQYLLDQPQQ